MFVSPCRFENIITNQFFGHTHRDEFKVFYDTQSGSRPISVGFVTPSVTPHTNVNMAYRIFTLDGDYEGTTRVKEAERLPSKTVTHQYAYVYIPSLVTRGFWTTTPTSAI